MLSVPLNAITSTLALSRALCGANAADLQNDCDFMTISNINARAGCNAESLQQVLRACMLSVCCCHSYMSPS